MNNNQPIKSKDTYGNEYTISVDQLRWRPAAYAIVVRENKLLLVKVRDGFHMPGGGIDLGETPEEAVIREIKEETGLIVTNPRLAGSLSTFFTHTHDLTKEMTHVQSLLLYFQCDLVGGVLSTDGLEDDEKLHGLTPEWIELETLDVITLGSTVDWRPIVKRATSA